MTEHSEAYDFRRPSQLADDVEQLLTQWRDALVKLAKPRLLENLNCSLPLEAGELRAMQVDAVAQLHTEPILIMQHRVGDSGVGWLTVPRRIILAMLEQMLGQAVTKLPEDRELTDIEVTLFDLFCQEMCQAMVLSQPCKPGLACERFGSPRFENIAQAFTESEQLIVAEISLLGDYQGQTFRWILSQKAVLRFVTHVTESGNKRNGPRPELARRVHQIPISVIVRLGKTSVHWKELADLRVGDVIILDQRVTDPLQAEISDQPMFLGWAGRHGNRQAFRISELIESETL
jgi:flagellar motor switch protein FliM